MNAFISLFLVANLLMFACGGAKKAEPTEVEIQWPDAAMLSSGQETLSDAGVERTENETPVPLADAMPAL